MDKLNPYYITGLTEGEGSFSVSFSLRKKLKVGIETRPSFSITLNKRDLPLIKKLHKYFNCGGVRFSKGDRTYKFEVRSVPDLCKKVIPHFDKYQLQGRKKTDFEIFKSICLKMKANLHLNAKELSMIIKDAYKMNPSGKRLHKQANLLKVLDKVMV